MNKAKFAKSIAAGIVGLTMLSSCSALEKVGHHKCASKKNEANSCKSNGCKGKKSSHSCSANGCQAKKSKKSSHSCSSNGCKGHK